MDKIIYGLMFRSVVYQMIGYTIKVRRPADRFVLHCFVDGQVYSHERELDAKQMKGLLRRFLELDPDVFHIKSSPHFLTSDEGCACTKCKGTGLFIVDGKAMRGICFACTGKGWLTPDDQKRNAGYWAGRQSEEG